MLFLTNSGKEMLWLFLFEFVLIKFLQPAHTRRKTPVNLVLYLFSINPSLCGQPWLHLGNNQSIEAHMHMVYNNCRWVFKRKEMSSWLTEKEAIGLQMSIFSPLLDNCNRNLNSLRGRTKNSSCVWWIQSKCQRSRSILENLRDFIKLSKRLTSPFGHHLFFDTTMNIFMDMPTVGKASHLVYVRLVPNCQHSPSHRIWDLWVL